mmetsp:Transcript_28809/g.51287  ORF Transcript_28809/g.51287 Transcript_28809/m.51287 type:complete len:297 (-) Transcript_28809:1423-2313(-)
MLKRSLRRRAPRAEYLLGYVEDDEPMDLIMKKFKQLEEFQTATGRETLTTEDCENLIESTTLGSIKDSFRHRYEISDVSASSSDRDEPGKPAPFIDPITQSYQRVKRAAGTGESVHQPILSCKLRGDFQAILINASAGMSLKQKKKLKFVRELMSNGLIFLWSSKAEIKEWIEVFERFNYQYVENLAWIKVDEEQVKKSGGLSELTDFTPELIRQDRHAPLNESHSTLLILRRLPAKKLELRHQRTCDVVFDYAKPREYVYHLIETLLPEADHKLELWATEETRSGWLHVIDSDNN